ncbi:hypothetical protein FKR81_30290 [Lentzea tibetensis]|uniref:Uncharacterized protein n=1 Tax=Lentzea tibetensis TaxID=2591470 RepID=A0A563EM06_9PSEU|nr:hypothetical protein [Lentzea tibetensis]TWP47961.1 hypothetical protein FKR81_30290 [Lentzea tibetensis]
MITTPTVSGKPGQAPVEEVGKEVPAFDFDLPQQPWGDVADEGGDHRFAVLGYHAGMIDSQTLEDDFLPVLQLEGYRDFGVESFGGGCRRVQHRACLRLDCGPGAEWKLVPVGAQHATPQDVRAWPVEPYLP